MNIDKIYDLLTDEGFKDPNTGNLFFPAYIYTYPPEQEYKIREQVKNLVKRLKRPNHLLDSMLINIYHELIEYLKEESFAKRTLFDQIIEKEKSNPRDALDWIQEEINQGNFYKRLETKIRSYFNNADNKRVYLIIYGFGSSFPFLRASDFLKKTEHLIKDFKIIILYPGTYKNASYHLFNKLDDDNIYRANYLNRQLSESQEQ